MKRKPAKIESSERDTRKEVTILFRNLKKRRQNLENLLAECNDHWGVEDFVYRFYHESIKVFFATELTRRIVKELRALLPGRPLNRMFMQIIDSGTGAEFCDSTNQNWFAETRPIIDAFLHARFFLEMAVKYGRELKFPPNLLPSGWAAILYLYDLR